MSADSSINVSVRVRPLTAKESGLIVPVSTAPAVFLGDGSLAPPTPNKTRSARRIIEVIDDRVLVFDPPDSDPARAFAEKGFVRPGTKRFKDQRYAFDRVFGEGASQEEVFDNTTRPLLDGILDGFNATVFAYGATGCGKTHTISGTPTDPGIIIRTMQELFLRISELEPTGVSVHVSLSYLEIYNETIRDLLAPPGSPPPPKGGLALQENADRRISVARLSEHHPRTWEEVLEMVLEGNRRRTMSPTMANATSSRSHAVLQVNVKRKEPTSDVEQCATLSIIDLAGSERASATQNSGARMAEGANINKSLLALGNCINALCEGAKGHIPYRNSKLTRLLKFSLGGNCKTVMIVCVSPASMHYEESQNTLKYANRAKNIKTKVSRNLINVDRHVREYVQTIAELREVNARLQNALDEGAELRSATEQRKRDAAAREVERAIADMRAKLDATLPSIAAGAGWETVLATAAVQAAPLEARLSVLAAMPQPLSPAALAEQALLTTLLTPLAAILEPTSPARAHLTQAQKSSAMLDATLRAIGERRYDSLDAPSVNRIRDAMALCRLEARVEEARKREDAWKAAFGACADAAAAGARAAGVLGGEGRALQEVIGDAARVLETARAMQKASEDAELALAAALSTSTTHLPVPPPSSATSSPAGKSGGFNAPPPLSLAMPLSRKASPLSPPRPSRARRVSAAYPRESPRKVTLRPGVASSSGAPAPAAAPPKKAFRWKDEAGEGDLWEEHRRAASGSSSESEAGWEDVVDSSPPMLFRSGPVRPLVQPQPAAGADSSFSAASSSFSGPVRPPSAAKRLLSSGVATRALGKPSRLPGLPGVGEEDESILPLSSPDVKGKGPVRPTRNPLGEYTNGIPSSSHLSSDSSWLANTSVNTSTASHSSKPVRPANSFAAPTTSSASRLSRAPSSAAAAPPTPSRSGSSAPGTPGRKARRVSAIGPMRSERSRPRGSLIPQASPPTTSSSATSAASHAGPIRYAAATMPSRSPRKAGRRSSLLGAPPPKVGGSARRLSIAPLADRSIGGDLSMNAGRPLWK